MDKKDNPSQTADFAAEMAAMGVKPLSKRQERHHEPPPPAASQGSGQKRKTVSDKHKVKQAAATGPRERTNKPLGDSVSDWLGPHDRVEFSRPGLQYKQLKNFRKGKVRPEITLDLHRHTVADARQRLIDFVAECQSDGIRCALVMHGKGFHSRKPDQGLYDIDVVAKIKSYTVHWLEQMPEVIAMASAQANDGGTGALYVLFTSRN